MSATSNESTTKPSVAIHQLQAVGGKTFSTQHLKVPARGQQRPTVDTPFKALEPSQNRCARPTSAALSSTTGLGDWRGALTFFKGFTSTQPSETFEGLAWATFRQKICPAVPKLVAEKKDALYFLPCLLRNAPLIGKTLERAEQNSEPTVGKMRSKDHVTESNVLIFDFDGIAASDFNGVRQFLEAERLTYVAYTTYSHGRDDKSGLRLRLCVPIDKPADSDLYVSAWNAAAKLLIVGLQKDTPATSMASVKLDPSGSKLYQQQGAWVSHPDRTSKAQHWEFDAGVLIIDALDLAPQIEQANTPTAPTVKEALPAPSVATSDANLVATRCNQIRAFRDTKGVDQSEPLWHDCLGVVGHCIEGRRHAHEWSQGHPGYNATETDKKLGQRLRVGPTTCDQFRSTNPDGCRGCKENVRGPIMLGRQQHVPSAAPKPQPVPREPFDTVEPYPQPVDLAQLLDAVREALTRFIIMSPHQRVAVTLWIAQTWLIERTSVAPLLLITAAERESGKTQLMSLVAMLCRRAVTVANSTLAFLFRAIERWQPTLFIDEADTFMKESSDQKGLINAGHTSQSAWVGRVVGENHEPTMFNVFCFKALAGINLAKHLPDATMSRGIIIALSRKRPDERCERLRHMNRDHFRELSSKLARFAQDYAEQIQHARPTLPDSLSDRQQDNWEPLFAIAECAGPEWLARCESAALALSRSTEMSESSGNSLLHDIREVFERKKCQKMSSAELIEALVEDQEAGWSTYNQGRQITPRQVAGLLRPYGITPKTVRLGAGDTPKGYDRQQFEDAFMRYLAPADHPDADKADTLDPVPDNTLKGPPESAF